MECKIVMLEGASNYEEWAVDVMDRLRAKNLDDVLETSIDEDESQGTLYRMWKRMDDKAREELIYSMQPHARLATGIDSASSAKHAWERTKKLYAPGDSYTMLEAMGQLQSKYTDFASPSGYIVHFRQNADRLAEMGFRIKDELLASMFVLGLPSELESLWMQIFHDAEKDRRFVKFNELAEALLLYDAVEEKSDADRSSKSFKADDFGKQGKKRVQSPNVKPTTPTPKPANKPINNKPAGKPINNKPADKPISKVECPNCKRPHDKKNCWYLYPEQRPDWWKTLEERKKESDKGTPTATPTHSLPFRPYGDEQSRSITSDYSPKNPGNDVNGINGGAVYRKYKKA